MGSKDRQVTPRVEQSLEATSKQATSESANGILGNNVLADPGLLGRTVVLSVPLRTGIDVDALEQLVVSAARLDVLHLAANNLTSRSLVRMGITEPLNLIALTYMLYPVVITASIEGDEGKRFFSAAAKVALPEVIRKSKERAALNSEPAKRQQHAAQQRESVRVEDVMRVALNSPGELELYALGLESYASLVKTGLESLYQTSDQVDPVAQEERASAFENVAESALDTVAESALDTVADLDPDSSAEEVVPAPRRLKDVVKQLKALDMFFDSLRQRHMAFKPQQVVDTMEKALELSPENPLFMMHLGEALVRLDRPYEALEILNAVSKLGDTPPARVLYVRGLAQLRLHMPALAVNDFSRAVGLRPEKASWWSALGMARFVSGELEMMCPDLYKACSLGDCDGLAKVREQNLCL